MLRRRRTVQLPPGQRHSVVVLCTRRRCDGRLRPEVRHICDECRTEDQSDRLSGGAVQSDATPFAVRRGGFAVLGNTSGEFITRFIWRFLLIFVFQPSIGTVPRQFLHPTTDHAAGAPAAQRRRSVQVDRHAAPAQTRPRPAEAAGRTTPRTREPIAGHLVQSQVAGLRRRERCSRLHVETGRAACPVQVTGNSVRTPIEVLIKETRYCAK